MAGCPARTGGCSGWSLNRVGAADGSPSRGTRAPSAATKPHGRRSTTPQVGPVVLDCDILTVGGSDLRIMPCTAEPGTEDPERLAFLTVLGTQVLVGPAT